MSDLDVIDQRLRRVERYLNFTSAGTQAGHSIPPTAAVAHDGDDDEDTAALFDRITAIEGRLDALADALEKLGADTHGKAAPDAETAPATPVGAPAA